jgi:hypothetical protein
VTGPQSLLTYADSVSTAKAAVGYVSTSVIALLLTAPPAGAQVPSPAAPGPADDKPAIRVGVTLFFDYTVQTEPTKIDADGNSFTPTSFNVGRAYLNVTGQINHLIAFRVTPDIVRDSGSDSSTAGSYVYRLKYAYGQFNLDDWMTPGSWARFGMQQTPWVDFIDSIYRYRFQGPTFEDREGILSSSDVGASFHYNFNNNYGDVHTGYYNGDNYNQPEANDQKAWMTRVTVRPLPTNTALRGLRVTGFVDADAYVANAERQRQVVGVTYEHPYVHAGFNYLWTTDQAQALAPELDGHGYSIWLTPKTAKGYGWEGLLRFDHLRQEQAGVSTEGERNRTIVGIAYWFPRQGAVSAAVMVDFEQVDNARYEPFKPKERRWAIHTLIGF